VGRHVGDVVLRHEAAQRIEPGTVPVPSCVLPVTAASALVQPGVPMQAAGLIIELLLATDPAVPRSGLNATSRTQSPQCASRSPEPSRVSSHDVRAANALHVRPFCDTARLVANRPFTALDPNDRRGSVLSQSSHQTISTSNPS